MALDGHTQTLLARHLSRPFAHYIARIRNKIRDLNDLLDAPAAFDEYDGRIIPMGYTRVFGPLPLTTPRRYDDDANNGFEKLATLASTTTFYTPRAPGNITIDRRGTFRWLETSLSTYINWTWSSNQGLGSTTQKAFSSQGDIFDDVVTDNGGALVMNNNLFLPYAVDNGNVPNDQPNVSFELGLFDKVRGRYLHDGQKLPSALFSGQTFTNRDNPEGIPFPAGADIEPRLFVDEIRIRDVLNTDTLYNAVQFKAFVVLSMLGVIEQETP